MKPDSPETAPPPPTAGDAELAAFVRALQSRARPEASSPPLPEIAETVRQVGSADDLVARFTAAATAAGMRVHHAALSDWHQTVRAILRGCGAKTALVAAQADSALTDEHAAALAAALRLDDIEVKSTLDDDTLFSTDAAVTGVTVAIAETGTIVCTSGAGQARGTSLIPPLHVAVVSARQLLPDLYDYFDQLGRAADLPANVNLISGPSKTADIEGILVTGVHGPGEVHIVLVTA